jgi:hypothetical protein
MGARYLQLFILLLSCLAVRSDILNCIRSIDGAYYDLTPLTSNTDLIINVTNTTNTETEAIYLEFNVCRFTTVQCHGKFTFASLYSNLTNVYDCISLSNTTKYDYIDYAVLDADAPGAGIQILFSNGDFVNQTINSWSPVPAEVRATNPNKTYSVAMNFHCDNDVVGITIMDNNFDTTNYIWTINMKSQDACSLVTLEEVWRFVDDNKIVFCVVGAVLGLLISVLGLKLFLPTLFIAGFVSGFFVALFTFFGSIVTPDSRESTKWILFSFAIVLGVALGYIAVKASKFGIFMIGAWFGTIISLILYNAVLYKIHSNPAELVLLITLGVLGLGGGILSLLFYKHVVIMATSLSGSYLMVRSISLVIGSFPNEIRLVQQIQNQDYSFSVSWPFYVYMNVIFIFTIIAACIQYKIKKRSEANEIKFENDDFKKLDI